MIYYMRMPQNKDDPPMSYIFCTNCPSHVDNALNARSDINTFSPTRLPIFLNTPGNVDIFNKVINDLVP